MNDTPTNEQRLLQLPLVGILRGLPPAQAAEVGLRLYAEGLRVLEVPLNSPDPFTSVRRLRDALPVDCLVGTGTVLEPDDVRRTREAGGQLVVAPNCDARVITAALEAGLLALPGVATATEAFTALRAGTRHLKLFPANSFGPGYLKALREVLPPGTCLYPVGGVGAATIADWVAAGAAGFGFGGDLYRPAYTLDDVGQRAARLVAAWRATRTG
ncbi:MAG: 2-dehydro-3-deoxy-6-phosphogalactonate aldolase [Pseudomonadota bacterium]|jgi:2-dehydro-3-deoxyphosphogalactonate aldolase